MVNAVYYAEKMCSRDFPAKEAQMQNVFHYPSPVGKLDIVENRARITGIFFAEEARAAGADVEETPCIREAERQLEEYFLGRRKTFDLPLSLVGSDFQRAVWAALLEIPYGETASYKEIALRVGNPNAARAVGMANHNNPVSIVVPCHRVIAHDGGLGGYGGGLAAKRYLLELEKRHA
jgi:methylated-DNA-[protein]-cysteine S-methyltransferase